MLGVARGGGAYALTHLACEFLLAANTRHWPDTLQQL